MAQKYTITSLPNTLTDAYADIQFPNIPCMKGNYEQLKIDSVDPATEAFTTITPHGLLAGDRVYFKNMGGAMPAGNVEVDTPYWVRAGALTSTTLTVALLSGGAAVTFTGTTITNVFINKCRQEIEADDLKNALVTCQFTRAAAGTNSAANFKLMDWFSGSTFYPEQTLTPGNPFVKAFDTNYQTATIAATATDYVKPVLVDMAKTAFKLHALETQTNTGNYGTVTFKIEGEVKDE